MKFFRLSCASLLWLFVAQTSFAQVTLEWKLTPGAVEKVVSETKEEQVLTIDVANVPIKRNRALTIRTEVGQPGADGSIRVEQKIDALLEELDLPAGNKISFNTNSPDLKAENTQLEFVLDLYRSISKTPFVVTLDRNLKIETATYDVTLPRTDNEIIDNVLKEAFSPDVMKHRFNRERGLLPGQPVKQADTWTRTDMRRLEGGDTLTFDEKLTYQGTVEKNGRTLDRITVEFLTAVYATNAASPIQVTNSDLKLSEGKGEFLFDRELGAIVSCSENFHAAGNLKMTAGGNPLEGKFDISRTYSDKRER